MLVGEGFHRVLVVGAHLGEHGDVFPYVFEALRGQTVPGREKDQVDEGEQAQNCKPEPQDHVDLLGKYVYGEHALHRVQVVAA